MIEFIIEENPDNRVLDRAARLLREGALVAVPTDTSWSIVCSIGSREGIVRLKKLSSSGPVRPLTAICASIAQASDLCEIGTAAFRVIKPLVPGPYVFVLPSSRAAAKEFELKRAEIGVRIPASPLVLALVERLGQSLLSMTAKRGMLDTASREAAEYDFPEDELFASGWELESIPGLELVLDTGEERNRDLATVLDLRDGAVQVLRQGLGPWP